MTSSFSWTDHVHMTVSSCLPCLRHAPSTDSLTNHGAPVGNPRLAPIVDGELRGLLADPTTEDEAETLSLHSNPGNAAHVRARARKAKTNARQRGITLFGYHLFGRPPIHLSDVDEDNDPLYRSHHNRSSRVSATGPISATTTIHSTATFDSDAAPLDVDTINNLSSSTAEALALAEEEERCAREEERRAKEERRQKRREKREMKMARALAADASIGDEFEGFQGSGGGTEYPSIPPPFMSPDDETVSSSVLESGDRASAPSPTSLVPHLAMQEGELDESADLDGMAYTRRHRPPPPSAPSSHHRRSDSHSRTSTSSSKTKKKKLTTKSSSARSKSTLSSNDSTSIASPTSPAFSLPPGNNASIATVVSPTTVEQGQGFFDYDHDEPRYQPVVSYTQQAFIAKDRPASGFPSTGLGGLRAQGGGMRGGAFLANTGAGGHEEEDDSFDGTF